MKTIGLFLALSLFAGCKKGGSAASQCADAIGKGVDKMVATGNVQGSALPPELKARMEAVKTTMTNRCTEDKWSPDVMKCYAEAGGMQDLRKCREMLPPDQQSKLRADMMKAMGGGPGMGGMPPGHEGMGGMPPGHEGMGGMPPGHEGMGGMPPGHEGMGGSAGGPAAAPMPPAAGSAAAPTAGSAAAGSAKP
jgi:hypothetical protein